LHKIGGTWATFPDLLTLYVYNKYMKQMISIWKPTKNGGMKMKWKKKKVKPLSLEPQK